ncbi:aminodeoxychorismate synthase component I [Candidatus Sumerlaeota bacterium]|nr:aminodeoxychorismate synthase component I [Candidatus Sumerlaeota bacterium]
MQTASLPAPPYLDSESLALAPSAMQGRRSALLLSGGGLGPWSLKSWIAQDPAFILLANRRGAWLEDWRGRRVELTGDPLDALTELLDAVRCEGDCGAFIGALNYEAGRWCDAPDNLFPQDEYITPDIALCYYPRLIEFDRERQTAQWRNGGSGARVLRRWFQDDSGLEAMLDQSSQRLLAALHAAAAMQQPSQDQICGINEKRAPLDAWRPSMPYEDYVRAIERILEYIRAGDIYQANYTVRFTREFHGDAAQLFARLCAINPASHAAWLDGGDWQILSVSPELFLRCGDGRAITRPIKGTRPRTPGRDEAAIRAELAASEKDRAEHVMIVDLERNDLGRVSEFHTVRVTELAAVETLPTLFHLTSTVEGRLRSGCGPAELLRAMFPGGSITGAPKIRSMQILQELETCPRGIYTGSIGMICPDGEINLNIAIRTLTLRDGQLSLGAGGGIVADSVPLAEWHETQDKARNLARAVESIFNLESR